MFFHGGVADPAVTDKATQAIREVADHMMKDERVDFSLVTVGDGVALCRKR